MSDNEKVVTDSTCADENSSYDSELVESANGLTASRSGTNYRGTTTSTGGSKDLSKLMFNSGSLSNKMTVKKAGVVAICYCQWASENTCNSSDYWVMAVRTTIRGPNLNARWRFSSNVVFRLEYTGFGLTSANKLRIISSAGESVRTL